MGAAPMIVVIPAGGCRWGCGQWADSLVTGNFEQYALGWLSKTLQHARLRASGPDASI
jgi:hypothetical protein